MAVHIVGRAQNPKMAAFDDVARAMSFDRDIYLGAHNTYFMGKPPIKGELIYNMEPLYDGCRALELGYMETLKQCDVLDYSRKNVEYLAARGVEAFYMPYGWHRGQQKYLLQCAPCNKVIDVLLVGSSNPRREVIVNRLRKRFRVEWVQGLYGQDLDELVARARVHLNIHFQRGMPLEVVRLNYLLANNCTVVTEPGNDDELNAVYSKMCYMTDNIEDGVERALSHPLWGVDRQIREHRHDCTAANLWANARAK